MRVLLISFLCVLGLLFTLVAVNQWGMSIPYQRFEHAFMKDQNPKLGVRIATTEEARRVVAAKADAILWLDVRLSSDKQFLILSPEAVLKNLTEKNFSPERWRGPVLGRYSFDEIRLLFPEAPLLQDVLQAFPKQRLILNVVDNIPDIHLDLVKLLEKHSPDERVLIQSDADVIMKSIKDQKAKWLYGSSHGDLMRLLSFDSVGIVPATPFRGDVLIAPPELKGRTSYNQAIIDEVHRRKKDVFLGPLTDVSQFDAARQSQVDGFVFATPELFLTYLDQKTP